MATTFDTLAAVRRLEDAGMKRDLAEAVAETAFQASGAEHDRLATKADLANLKAELTNKIYAVAAAQAVLIVALLKLLP